MVPKKHLCELYAVYPIQNMAQTFTSLHMNMVMRCLPVAPQLSFYSLISGPCLYASSFELRKVLVHGEVDPTHRKLPPSNGR